MTGNYIEVEIFVICNEHERFLQNSGVWTKNKADAFLFSDKEEAQALIEKLSEILPAFEHLYPFVTKL